MPSHRGTVWSTLLLTVLFVACGDAPYEPTPGALVGEFSGQAGESFQTYDLFLAVDQVDDSVRGLWSLAFQTSCSTHDGPFSGTPSEALCCNDFAPITLHYGEVGGLPIGR